MRFGGWFLLLAWLALATLSPAAELKFRAQEIGRDLKVGYAVSLVDVNADGKTDAVVVDSNRVIWYENPGWRVHTIIQDQTQLDNVCIAPHDIDGDGRVDFALGAGWKPSDTQGGGTIQWLARGPSADERWQVRAIDSEPTVHRMRWVDLRGTGKPELVAVPLFGRGTSPPDYAQRGVRILAYSVPADPARDRWPVRTLNEDLHVTHNFFPTDLNTDGRLDLLVTSFEGVNLLQQSPAGDFLLRHIGTGNQQTSPNRGASEIKRGHLASGTDYIATIEPWHGFQVVVYTRPSPSHADSPNAALWKRQVLDDDLKWGHAVWCADLDGDKDEELVIGVRDNKDARSLSGLRIYDPQDGQAANWKRHLFDPGGVSIEDLAVADLNADGRPDIVASGRHTHNVRIYWNETR